MNPAKKHAVSSLVRALHAELCTIPISNRGSPGERDVIGVPYLIVSRTFYDAGFFLFYAVSTLVLWRDGARGVTDWKGN
jgi:hypothetical protein